MTRKGKVRQGDGEGGRQGEDKAEQRRDGDGLFVDAIAADRGGADAGRCRCHGNGCCKDKNQTILGDSLGKQGGRRGCTMAMPLFLLYRVLGPRSRRGGATQKIASQSDRYCHEDVSRMAGRTHGEERSAVAQRQECRDWAFTAEPAAKELSCQQELGEVASEGEGNAGYHKGVPHPTAMSLPFPSCRSHDMHRAASIRIASFTAGTSSGGIQQIRP